LTSRFTCAVVAIAAFGLPVQMLRMSSNSLMAVCTALAHARPSQLQLQQQGKDDNEPRLHAAQSICRARNG
jgi:hypothetical protein